MSQLLNTNNLDEVLTVQPGEVMIGKLVHLGENHIPMVDYPCNPTNQPLSALTTVVLSPQNDIGREVALLFAEGDLRKPVIMGLIHTPNLANQFTQSSNGTLELQLNGEKVIFSAEEKIILQCGKASITLTQNGKIIIRGTDILSRSSGSNRLKGGSIQFN